MREFNFIIDEALTRGIHPDSRQRRNIPSLVDAYNMEITEHGLDSYQPIIDPSQGGIPVDFPYPQMFVGKNEMLMMSRDTLYRLSTNNIPWQALTPYVDTESRGNYSRTPGIWQFADAGDWWMLTNGKDLIYPSKYDELNHGHDTLKRINNMAINTCCYHRGRIMTGGFRPYDAWGDSWMNLFREFKDELDDPISLDWAENELSENWVMWGSIGGGDFPMWLFEPQMAVYGPLDDSIDKGYDLESIDRTFLIEALKKNQFGWMQMPWQGTVMGVAPVGKNVIVLGEGGVTALYMASGTYGMQPISRVGLASRGAFHASEAGCLWVDRGGTLRMLDGEMNASTIGYKHIFSDMLGGEIMVSYDSDTNRYFIANRNEAYCLSQAGGLTRIGQRPTSASFYDGGLIGFFEEDTSQNAVLVTNIYDLEVRSLKTITSINIGVVGGQQVSACVDYRYNSNDEWSRSEFIQVNKEGNVYVNVTALEFRFVVKAEDYTDFKIDYIDVRYQTPDNRSIRGRYVNTHGGD